MLIFQIIRETSKSTFLCIFERALSKYQRTEKYFLKFHEKTKTSVNDRT